MNYNIYILEKNKKKEYKSAMEEYVKRLSKYTSIEIKFFKKEKQVEKLLKKEGIHFQVIPNKDTCSSIDFSRKIEQYGMDGVKQVSFYIGFSSFDLELFSLASMEMNHQLTATILLEQIYRSYRIINNQAYHK